MLALSEETSNVSFKSEKLYQKTFACRFLRGEKCNLKKEAYAKNR